MLQGQSETQTEHSVLPPLERGQPPALALIWNWSKQVTPPAALRWGSLFTFLVLLHTVVSLPTLLSFRSIAFLDFSDVKSRFQQAGRLGEFVICLKQR